MIDLLQYFAITLAAIFVIINPITTAFIFLALLPNASHRKKRYVALRSVKVATIILFLFALLGGFIFLIFGLSVAAFRVAGGIILFSIALNMIRKDETEHNEKAIVEDDNLETADNVSIIPLAIPFMSGPGSIATVMILTSETPTPYHVSLILLAILVTTISCYFSMVHSERLVDFVGQTGKRVITKVFGLLLAVISVQFVINGVLDVLPEVLAILGNI